MKFFLCQNQPISGYYDVNFSVEVTPNANAHGREADFWKELQPVTPERSHRAGRFRNLEHLSAEGQIRLQCEIFDNNGTAGFRIRSGPVTSAVRKIFGDSGSIQVGITNFSVRGWGDIGDVETSEMKVVEMQGYACIDPDLLKGVSEFSTEYLDLNRHDCTLYGMVTVTVETMALIDKLKVYKTLLEKGIYSDLVIIPENGAALKTQKAVFSAQMLKLKKMLQEGIQSDLVVIPENGVEVKAHKTVLAAHSAVFSAMFGSDMQEAKTHKLEMPDMTEAGVRGLLAFLYCWEETEPNAQPLVAYEMLCAGHKYHIPELESGMKNLLLDKPIKWFQVDVAMKLFLFAKNLPPEDGKCLKKKAMQVLIKNSATLMQSPAFATLFEKDPKAAMEFCVYAMDHGKQELKNGNYFIARINYLS